MKSVMLVCLEWKDVGEAPHFWALVSLRVIMEKLATMPEVLGRRRLQGVRELRVRAMSQDLLRVAAWQKGLRTVDMAETVLLAVRDAVMTTERTEEIMDGMSTGDTRLSKFLVTIKTRDVKKILAPFYFLLSLLLLIPLEAFYQQL